MGVGGGRGCGGGWREHINDVTRRKGAVVIHPVILV